MASARNCRLCCSTIAKFLETLKSIACRPGPVKLPTWQLPKPLVGCETDDGLNHW